MARRGWLTGAAERFQSVDFRFGFACEYLPTKCKLWKHIDVCVLCVW